MADIQVTIVMPATQARHTVELPDDAQISQLLPAIAESLSIEKQAGGVTEYKLSYKGPQPPDPFDFKDDDTLASRGVKAGATLAFTHSFIAG